ncbi:hypothetical protein BESB_083300 [Besnoitia besnoiti]|uniref:Uncharacterized protein n=1 Tax=Besnoitia besnoiti TaxID=94643 RepID=A0A2A9M9Y4_BESBE|nr:hypothetical protein BESB_083300 [Besnoitia besnoiti]PFH33131.1 hypothetical protein BESB_083300 [Besnoitia besnoiti]
MHVKIVEFRVVAEPRSPPEARAAAPISPPAVASSRAVRGESLCARAEEAAGEAAARSVSVSREEENRRWRLFLAVYVRNSAVAARCSDDTADASEAKLKEAAGPAPPRGGGGAEGPAAPSDAVAAGDPPTPSAVSASGRFGESMGRGGARSDPKEPAHAGEWARGSTEEEVEEGADEVGDARPKRARETEDDAAGRKSEARKVGNFAETRRKGKFLSKKRRVGASLRVARIQAIPLSRGRESSEETSCLHRLPRSVT